MNNTTDAVTLGLWIIENLNWLLPLGITTMFSLTNVLLTRNTIKNLKLQAKMQNDSFCYTLYERRMLVYNSIKLSFSLVFQDATISLKDINSFTRETSCVKFLFGQDVDEYCCALRKLYLELSKAERKIRNSIDRQIDDPLHEQLVDKSDDILTQIISYQNDLDTLFAKYISFAEYSIAH